MSFGGVGWCLGVDWGVLGGVEASVRVSGGLDARCVTRDVGTESHPSGSADSASQPLLAEGFSKSAECMSDGCDLRADHSSPKGGDEQCSWAFPFTAGVEWGEERVCGGANSMQEHCTLHLHPVSCAFFYALFLFLYIVDIVVRCHHFTLTFEFVFTFSRMSQTYVW